jgi:hypothetical protein
MLDLKSVRENQDLYVSLNERGHSDKAIEQSTAKEMFREYLEWNGIIGYESDIRNALWTLITSSDRYLATTDQDREEWLKSMLGFGSDPA